MRKTASSLRARIQHLGQTRSQVIKLECVNHSEKICLLLETRCHTLPLHTLHITIHNVYIYTHNIHYGVFALCVFAWVTSFLWYLHNEIGVVYQVSS